MTVAMKRIISALALLLAAHGTTAPAWAASRPPSGLVPATTHYDFNVTVARRAPDCFGE